MATLAQFSDARLPIHIIIWWGITLPKLLAMVAVEMLASSDVVGLACFSGLDTLIGNMGQSQPT
eukprot:2124757-Amphidinium_carterae.2